ncbi:hypothetical protein KQI84_15855 [bacterium]|nr:hypothetical protein [bacterium]
MSPALDAFVDKQRMRITFAQRYDSFGNIVVVASAVDFDLRVCRDRGSVGIDVSPSNQNDWHLLDRALEFLGIDVKEEEDTDELVKALSANLEKIIGLMKSDLKEIGFIEFEREAVKRCFPVLFEALELREKITGEEI